MCVTDRYDMNLAVKVALNPNTTYLTIGKKLFENILGKEENAGLPAFSPFPKRLSTLIKG